MGTEDLRMEIVETTTQLTQALERIACAIEAQTAPATYFTLDYRVAQLASVGVVPMTAPGSDTDRDVARESTCPACGRVGLIYQPFVRATTGEYVAAVAYCFDDYASISF